VKSLFSAVCDHNSRTLETDWRTGDDDDDDDDDDGRINFNMAYSPKTARTSNGLKESRNCRRVIIVDGTSRSSCKSEKKLGLQSTTRNWP